MFTGLEPVESKYKMFFRFILFAWDHNTKVLSLSFASHERTPVFPNFQASGHQRTKSNPKLR